MDDRSVRRPRRSSSHLSLSEGHDRGVTRYAEIVADLRAAYDRNARDDAVARGSVGAPVHFQSLTLRKPRD